MGLFKKVISTLGSNSSEPPVTKQQAVKLLDGLKVLLDSLVNSNASLPPLDAESFRISLDRLKESKMVTDRMVNTFRKINNRLEASQESGERLEPDERVHIETQLQDFSNRKKFNFECIRKYVKNPGHSSAKTLKNRSELLSTGAGVSELHDLERGFNMVHGEVPIPRALTSQDYRALAEAVRNSSENAYEAYKARIASYSSHSNVPRSREQIARPLEEIADVISYLPKSPKAPKHPEKHDLDWLENKKELMAWKLLRDYRFAGVLSEWLAEKRTADKEKRTPDLLSKLDNYLFLLDLSDQASQCNSLRQELLFALSQESSEAD